MGYHSDPQDNKWDNDFIVINIGQTRRFIFREISNKYKKKEFTFSDGDIIYMFDDCQKNMNTLCVNQLKEMKIELV